MRKLVCGLLRPPSIVTHFALSCGYPSCVEVIVKEFGLVGVPPSVEVIVGVLALSLIPLVRGDCGGVFEFRWYPCKCRGDCGWCLALCLIPLL